MRRAIDLDSDEVEVLESAAPVRPPAGSVTNEHQHVVRTFRAANLQDATRIYRRLRQSATEPSRFLLLVQVVLADNAATALRLHSDAEADLSPTSYVYIGTLKGLRGLLRDIQMAQVADVIAVEALPVGGTERILQHRHPTEIPGNI